MPRFTQPRDPKRPWPLCTQVLSHTCSCTFVCAIWLARMPPGEKDSADCTWSPLPLLDSSANVQQLTSAAQRIINNSAHGKNSSCMSCPKK